MYNQHGHDDQKAITLPIIKTAIMEHVQPVNLGFSDVVRCLSQHKHPNSVQLIADNQTSLADLNQLPQSLTCYTSATLRHKARLVSSSLHFTSLRWVIKYARGITKTVGFLTYFASIIVHHKYDKIFFLNISI